MEAVLQQILSKLTDIEATMVTKSEFNEMVSTLVTKDEFNEMVSTLVTKDEFNQIVSTLVTKDEFNQIISTLATKDELNELKLDLRAEMSDLRTEMREGFARVDRKLNAISEQVAYNAEQEIRISHLEAEVRIIKKTLSNM